MRVVIFAQGKQRLLRSLPRSGSTQVSGHCAVTLGFVNITSRGRSWQRLGWLLQPGARRVECWKSCC